MLIITHKYHDYHYLCTLQHNVANSPSLSTLEGFREGEEAFLLHILILTLLLGEGLNLGCSSYEFSGSIMSVRFGLREVGSADHGEPPCEMQAHGRRVHGYVDKEKPLFLEYFLLHQTLHFA